MARSTNRMPHYLDHDRTPSAMGEVIRHLILNRRGRANRPTVVSLLFFFGTDRDRG